MHTMAAITLNLRVMILFSLFMVVLLPVSWSFSNNRIIRRISSAEIFSDEDSQQYDDDDEYFDRGQYTAPKQTEYVQILPTSNISNSTDRNLYVIKAVVYEVGILTNVPENDTQEDVKNERIDISFFNSGPNGSIIDLQHIPFPVQANVSGQVITGLAPVPLGHILEQNISDNSTIFEDNTGEFQPSREKVQSIVPILSPYDIFSEVDSSNNTEKGR